MKSLQQLALGRLTIILIATTALSASHAQNSPIAQDSPAAQSPGLPPQYQGKPLTIQDALQIGLANNPQLVRAGENLRVAQGRVGEAKSAFYPTLTAGPGENYIKSIWAPAYFVQATMPLDISRLLQAATAQAQFQEVGARLDVNRIRNEVVYGVEHAFYAALRSEALVTVALENEKDSQERLRNAQARYEARAVAYIDVVRAQTELANAQKQVIQAKSDVSNQMAQLANSLGIEVTTPISIAATGGSVQAPKIDVSPATNPAANTPAAVTLGPEFTAALTEALVTRPEILEADADLAAAKKGILIARRSELPSVALGVGYFDTRSNTGTQIREPQAFVGLSVPLFDGGLARARVDEAKATVGSAVTARRQQVDAVTLDVQQAYLALVDARDQIGVTSQALVEARTAYSLAQVRYNTGVSSHAGISPLLELDDAQAALTLAEQNDVNARYDYDEAQARLDRSVGGFAYVANGPGYPAVPAPAVVGKSVK